MSYPTTWRPPSFFPNPYVRYGVILGVLGYFILSFLTLDADWQRTLKGIPRAIDIFQRMFPPNFSRWEILVRGVLESPVPRRPRIFIGEVYHLDKYHPDKTLAKSVVVH